MNFTLLKEKFKFENNYDASSRNELLVYAKKLYLQNEMNICEYRELMKVLDSEGQSAG
ncbi:YppF family protein [Bacillus kexueae]|uniref:YppF family protein n=1 Tax=Aeribacillus kexueae TaxID=2078952 RepID=UPI001FAE7918|nr:YppF family protein [Bacillus kexueae]